MGLGGLCWAQKSVLEGLLGGSGGHLGPSWPQEQLKTPRGEEMGLQGPPWDPLLGGQVGPRWGQVGAKWAIIWLSCGLVHSSLAPRCPKMPQVGKFSSNLASTWPSLASRWPQHGSTWPNLTSTWLNLAQFGLNMAQLGPPKPLKTLKNHWFL